MHSLLLDATVGGLGGLGVAGGLAELGHEGRVGLAGAISVLSPGAAILAAALATLGLKRLGVCRGEHNAVSALVASSGLFVGLLDGLLGGLLGLLCLLVGLLGLLVGLLCLLVGLGTLAGLLLGSLLGLLGSLLGLPGVLDVLLSCLSLSDRLLGNLGVLLDALGFGLALLRGLVQLDGLGLHLLVLASSNLHDVLSVHLLRLRNLELLLLLGFEFLGGLQLLLEALDDLDLRLDIEHFLVHSELVLVERSHILLERASQGGGGVHGGSDLVVLLLLLLLLGVLHHDAFHDRETTLLHVIKLVGGLGSSGGGVLCVRLSFKLFPVAGLGGELRHFGVHRGEHHFVLARVGVKFLIVPRIRGALDELLVHGENVVELLHFGDDLVNIAGNRSAHAKNNHHRGAETHHLSDSPM